MAKLDFGLDALFNGIANYFTNRQNLKAQAAERKNEIEILKQQARIERIKNGQIAEKDYDLLVLSQSASTMIDEIMILWVLAIVTCLFIPNLAPYAIQGFHALSQVPMWFQTVFVGCFIAKLGLRFLFSGRPLFGQTVK